jgi:hypothetical protein
MSQPEKMWLRRTCWLLAVVLVVAMLYVFIAPSLDLAPSALRAMKAALAVLICLRLWCYAVASRPSILPFLCGVTDWIHRESIRGPLERGRLDLHCARLC